jgi:DNA-binding transcriptional MerR regulator
MYIGMHPDSEQFIRLQNKNRFNIEKLQEVDLEELGHVKVQILLDIVEDEYECPKCERHDKDLENWKEQIHEMISEMYALVNSVRENMTDDITPEERKKYFEEHCKKLQKAYSDCTFIGDDFNFAE